MTVKTQKMTTKSLKLTCKGQTDYKSQKLLNINENAFITIRKIYRKLFFVRINIE